MAHEIIWDTIPADSIAGNAMDLSTLQAELPNNSRVDTNENIGVDVLMVVSAAVIVIAGLLPATESIRIKTDVYSYDDVKDALPDLRMSAEKYGSIRQSRRDKISRAASRVFEQRSRYSQQRSRIQYIEMYGEI